MRPSDYHVLLVDDDPAMLRILAKWLEGAGYRVGTAGNGVEALLAIDAQCPDFVITDWEMPEMNGLELCRRVRQRTLPHYVYILFLTVKTAPAEMIEGLNGGADDFIGKPVRQEEMLARLQAGFRVLELERRLNEAARIDPLTGLLTQRAFYELLEKEWRRSERAGRPLSCAMIDLDFFKQVNDNHGHRSGDAVLKAVADLLTSSCRAGDVVCRYGGEEFCVALPETCEEEAARWADRIRRRIAETVVRQDEKAIRLTASIGVAQRNPDTHTAEQLVDRADEALLCAKQAGRDRVVRYESFQRVNDIDLRSAAEYDDLFRGIEARHVMSPLVACLREDQTVGQAAEYFLRSRTNSAPVVDAEGALAGILSEKDLLAVIVSLDCWRRPVGEVMKPNVISFSEETPIRTIYEFLCRVSIRRVVIVRDGRPTGTISRGTLLRWFRNLLVNKGLLESPDDLRLDARSDPYHTRQRLAATAEELAHQASILRRSIELSGEDLTAHVVGGATGIQGLATDLLAYSRFAGPSAVPAAVEGVAAGQSV